jgi:hypothetical protein
MKGLTPKISKARMPDFLKGQAIDANKGSGAWNF